VYDIPSGTNFKTALAWSAQAAATDIATSGHSFDNGGARLTSKKDRRETKETGKERGNGLTRFTALD
jgi:hypothetical protein